jgi:hypothetical protein
MPDTQARCEKCGRSESVRVDDIVNGDILIHACFCDACGHEWLCSCADPIQRESPASVIENP